MLDAQGLEGDAMQAIAREFNHPETVFVFVPADPGHRARLRIFTPVRELPFAGHPTVGTAVLLGRIDGGKAADRHEGEGIAGRPSRRPALDVARREGEPRRDSRIIRRRSRFRGQLRDGKARAAPLALDDDVGDK